MRACCQGQAGRSRQQYRLKVATPALGIGVRAQVRLGQEVERGHAARPAERVYVTITDDAQVELDDHSIEQAAHRLAVAQAVGIASVCVHDPLDTPVHCRRA